MFTLKSLLLSGVVATASAGAAHLYFKASDADSASIRFVKLAPSANAGYLPGDFAVSANGTPNYDIPIPVPPGTNGVAPELSISYGDLRSNGILGMGWNLSGLTAITRSGEIFPNDSAKTGISFTNADRFVLNGQRLIAYKDSAGKLLTTIAARNAAYGRNGTEYRTELESWTRVFSYGAAGTGPAYFIAWAKDGSRMQFGNTADSRIQPSGAPAALAWGLNQAQDRNGNYVLVTYTPGSQQGNAMPMQISYTGNAAGKLPVQRMVEFSYIPRKDTITSYVNGVKLSTPVLLNSIQTYVDQDGDGKSINAKANLVNTYSLFYSNSVATGRSLLDSIKAGDAAGNFLPATSFAWTSYDVTNNFTDTLTSLPSNFQTILNGINSSVRADFNGDGLPDIVLLQNGSSSIMVGAMKQGCRMSTKTIKVPSGFSQYINALKSQTLPGDYNGDGLTDIAIFQPGQTFIAILLMNPDGQFTGQKVTIPSAQQQYFSGLALAASGDFNGDGLADITAFTSGSTAMPVLLTQTGVKFAGYTYTVPGEAGRYFSGLGAAKQIGDYNGDGLADITVFYANQPIVPVLFSNGKGSFSAAMKNLPSGFGSLVNAAGANQVSGDFNGDGLGDFAVFNIGSGKLPVICSQGNGQFSGILLPLSDDAKKGFNSNGVLQVAGDINGDGVTDLTAYGNGYKTVPSLISSGNGKFRFIAETLAKKVQPNLNAPDANRFIADFNGDGMLDIAALVHHLPDLPVIVSNKISTTNTVPDLVTGIKDGIGSVISINYKPLTDSTVYSGNSTALEYPLLSMAFPACVVSSWQIADADNGATSILKYACKYQSAVIDQYRGWLGFAKTFRYDYQNNTTLTSINLPQFPYCGLAAQERVAQLSDTSKLMEVISYDYQSALEQKTGISLVWNNRTVSAHYTQGHFNYASVEKYAYDATHQVITKISKTNNNSGDSLNVYLYSQYKPSPAVDSLWWQAFFPLQQKTSYDSVSVNWTAWTTPDLSWTKYSYDSRMNIRENRTYMNAGSNSATGQWVGTSHVYDAFGNKLAVKTPPNSGKDSIVTQTFFDSIYHTFPVRTLFPDPKQGGSVKGLSSSAVFDPRFGLAAQQTNLNGQVEFYIPDKGLDGFGRILITQAVQPDSKTLATLSVNRFAKKVYAGYTVTTSQPVKWTASVTPDTSWQSTVDDYDGFDRNYKTTGNGYNPETTLITENAYDVAGKVKAVLEPCFYFKSKRDSFQYVPGGPVYSKRFEQQQLYNTNGILSEVTLPDPYKNKQFVTEKIVYDSLDDRNVQVWKPSPANDAVMVYWKKTFTGSGNLKSKSGPYNADNSKGDNFSTVTYKYDGLGRLITIIDPLGEKILTGYNSLSQVIYKYRPETDTIRYALNNNGWLVTVTDQTGTVNTVYDDLGRALERTQQAVKGKAETVVKYVYDDVRSSPNSKGLLSAKTINGATYTYGYDLTGALRSQKVYIDSLAKPFVIQFRTDPLGRIDTIIYPDSTLAVYTFDRMSNLKSVRYDNKTVMTYNAYTASGEVSASETGNKVSSSITYDRLGRDSSSATCKGAFVMRAYQYRWNNAGKLLNINDTRNIKDSSLTQDFSYFQSGRMATADGYYGKLKYMYDAAGNCLSTQDYTYTYDKVKKHELTGVSKAGKQLYSFKYNAAGSLEEKKILQSAAAGGDLKVDYSYDAQGNLLQVQGTAGSQPSETVDQFTYDDEGNRLCKKDSDNTVTWYISPFYEAAKVNSGDVISTKYVYGNDQLIYSYSEEIRAAAKRKQEKKAIDKRTREGAWSWWFPFLEKNGGYALNLLVYAGYLLILLSLVFLIRMAVNMRGYKNGDFSRRIARAFQNRVSFRFQLMLFTSLLLLASPASATPTQGPNGPGVPVAGEERYYHHDHLGSTVLLTDKNGGLTNSVEYQPFGSIDSKNSTGQDNFRQKYTGKEFDTYIGLYYFGARYYDSDLGRFISPDAAEQFFSPYAYGDDDPMSGTDPDGNEFVGVLAAIAVVLVVGAFAYIGASIANNSFNPTNWAWNSSRTWVGMIAGAAVGVAMAAAAVATVLSGGSAGVALSPFVTLAIDLAMAALDVAFLATDIYTLATEPSVSNGIFVAIDLIPFATMLGRGLKTLNKSLKGGKALQREARFRGGPAMGEMDDLLEAGTCAMSFTAGTTVLTPGGEKAIETIAVGDEVIAADVDTQEKGTYAVARIFRRVAVGLALLVTTAGDTVAVTPEHPFYTAENGWTEVKDVQPGEHIVTNSYFSSAPASAIDERAAFVVVASLRIIPDTIVTVYNFEVEKVHNYFVSGSQLLVHNTKCSGLITAGRNVLAGKSGRAINALTDYWPKNNGAWGNWENKFLMPGTEIDRFGKETGKFVSPINTPMERRALPPSNTGPYHAYKVAKPFEVRASVIAPAFGKPGLGTQYFTQVDMTTLLRLGIITPIK